jgi:hypothetical protein
MFAARDRSRTMSEPVEMVWEDCSQGTTPRPFETKQVRALWAFFGFDVQAFDRWLASVKADAWRLGFYKGMVGNIDPNPYEGVDDE